MNVSERFKDTLPIIEGEGSDFVVTFGANNRFQGSFLVLEGHLNIHIQTSAGVVDY